MSFNKVARRKKIRTRIRAKINGTAQKPRLSVFRSNTHIYVQLINDLTGHTILSISSQDKGIDEKLAKVEVAKTVGALVAQNAIAKGITEIVFDRGGFLYHGRIKALAEGAREGGLKF
jgi:large subunit ribosomal protein L18